MQKCGNISKELGHLEVCANKAKIAIFNLGNDSIIYEKGVR